MGELEGMVAVVTGAGSGIGRAGAQLFAQEGAQVVVAELRRDRGESVASEIVDSGGDAIAIEVDVRDRESVVTLVSSTVRSSSSGGRRWAAWSGPPTCGRRWRRLVAMAARTSSSSSIPSVRNGRSSCASHGVVTEEWV